MKKKVVLISSFLVLVTISVLGWLFFQKRTTVPSEVKGVETAGVDSITFTPTLVSSKTTEPTPTASSTPSRTPIPTITATKTVTPSPSVTVTPQTQKQVMRTKVCEVFGPTDCQKVFPYIEKYNVMYKPDYTWTPATKAGLVLLPCSKAMPILEVGSNVECISLMKDPDKNLRTFKTYTQTNGWPSLSTF